MMDESLLKSNFIGRDGFRWWIGQIPPMSVQDKQANGPGWGNRFKVRIMGYHPANEQELPNEDLPWAQVLLPATSGTGGGNRNASVMLTQGDVVFGFFLDGDNAQIPVIMGAFGRTAAVPGKDFSQPFVPFTGYTSNIAKPASTTLKADQSGDQNANAQKSPRHVSPVQASGISTDEVSYSSVIGETVRFANPSSSSTLSKISTEINNLLTFIQNISTVISDAGGYLNRVIDVEVDKVTKKIQDIVTGLVNGMISDVYKKMAPSINKGLKLLYKFVYDLVFSATKLHPIAHQAGVSAQQAMVGPVIALQQAIPALANSIIGGLGELIKSILKSVVSNVTRFASCVANQFVGVLTNSIIGQVASGLSSQIDGIQKITQFVGGINLDSTMRSSPGMLGGLGEIVNAGRSASNFESSANEWVIGRGPKSSKTPNFGDILKAANDAYALATSVSSTVSSTKDLINGFSNFASDSASININGCYSGPPTFCGAPTINIFGSNGFGATAIPILGNIIGEGKNRTGSLMGIKVTNPGSGYDFPPFVEIVDECNQGYGAIAQAVLNNQGQIDYIYIVSEGENYPVGELDNYVVTGINVRDPGKGYVKGDIAVDNFGNTYDLQIVNGGVTQVSPLNIVSVTDLPVLTILSENGSGALLSPIVDTRPEYQGEVKQVIDCITK